MPVESDQLLPVVRVGDIPNEDHAQRWLVEPLWGDSSVGVIGGAPKCSKTWLGLDLALSLRLRRTGTACLGKYAVPQPGPVLVYLAEDALPIVRQRVAGMARHRGLELVRLRRIEIHVITAPTLQLDREPHRGPPPADSRRRGGFGPGCCCSIRWSGCTASTRTMPAKWPGCWRTFAPCNGSSSCR